MIKFLSRIVNRFFYRLFWVMIGLYQKLISPMLPARCRYYPTCSQYGKQALALHGVWRGGGLLVRRIGRCHPLGGHGVDFVPLPLYQYVYVRGDIDKDGCFQGRFVYVDTVSYAYHLNQFLLRFS